MSVFFSQDARMGRLTTVLGTDELVLQRFDGTDHINALYDYQVDCLASSADVDFDALIGTHASVALVTREGSDQYFDGIVTEARWLGTGDNGHKYRLRLQPWFFLASLRRNQRIFHNKTVVEILTELLGSYSDAGKLTVNLANDYPELEYTVQYRESDMAFATRMMERHGISYHFTHSEGAHEMVLSDAVEAHATIGAVPFKPDDGHHQADFAHFWDWHPARRITTGAIRLTDYNFKTPNAAMETDQIGDAEYAQGQIESFDWPGDYLAQSRGRVVAQLRTQGERGQDRRYEAVGDIITLRGGTRVDLAGDTVPGIGEEYICLSASHSYTSDNYGSGGTEGDGYAYSGRYILMPSSAPLVPELKTPRADVKGPQTAVVVGDGEIDCDEYGRILVQFHWDLDADYSMRCRVSQSWAGNGWGGMVIPRIGMEVVVEFLDGDPDKPLVTGCVYNGKNAVPYDLPANKTVSTFKSDTHQGSGYNEFRFEDEKDREEVFMHAQKDHNTIIENDESHSIGHDRSKTVGNDQSESIGHDKTISVGNDHRENIGQDMYYDVARNQQENYGKDHIHRVGNIHKQSIYADHLYEVGRNYQGEVAGKFTLDVGSSITNNTGKHTLMAFEKFQIKGPGGKITIDASGITLEAAKINLKGAVSMGGSGSAQVPTLQMAAKEGLPLCEECAAAKEDS
ncbi:type VI secretion system tip protein TssI/VgrG (plasmid) [Thioclava litoralis]|uniref:Type VI secretion system tip protein TssI/VgrG n=1 Tax=Thioclava litoralis TaxID=3076557 RepID=A0ABZ1E3U6_9RHOB|nr:type VI secretion system tip protein TssI/VgrG [Thioclava sp. FTW29]